MDYIAFLVVIFQQGIRFPFYDLLAREMIIMIAF